MPGARASPRVFYTLRDQAGAVAALPIGGTLPCRTVLVPGEPAAHALRGELIRGGHGAVLAGTRFILVTPGDIHVLHAAGVQFAAGEEALRPIRLLTLVRGSLPLRHYPASLLRDRPGCDHGFARAVADLEAAGLSPDHLDAAGDARLADVATVWRTLDETAGRSWTAARIYREAAAVLEREPDAWPFFEPVLATVLDDGTLPVGYVDLFAVRDDELIVLDFKTDAPPAGDVEVAFPEYVGQARLYGRPWRPPAWPLAAACTSARCSRPMVW
ncbi:MAG TPA: hypothetical protein VNO23_08255 [Candidatus Binatia bacterium]|nr:hypothetical protein [Candidatus Binatia bacterium]